MAAESDSIARETQALRRVANAILFEPASAEDAVQEAWLAALRREGRVPGGGWLRGAVVRIARGFRRKEARVRSRERAAARGEATPSALETSARLEVLRELVLALESLPEPYRTVVRLRFVDDLPPREIADRLQLPVETVRTQIKRGVERLRVHLDARHPGGRASLLSALAPLAGLRPAPVPPGHAPWSPSGAATGSALEKVLLMTVKTKIGLSAAALAALLLLAFWAVRGPRANSPALDPAAPDALAETQPAIDAPPALAPTEAVPERTLADLGSTPRPDAAAAASPPTTGSVLVRTVWADDKAPAADVLVELRPSGDVDPLFDVRRGTTDANGEVRFSGVALRRHYASPLRGSLESGSSVTLVAGEEVVSTIELKLGMNLHGEVVDHRDRPIAGAEVLVAPWGGGDAVTLTRTDLEGRFHLRGLGTHCHVGARAKGFAPSNLRQFTASEGAEAELRLVLAEPGTEVSGVVLGTDGQPLAGAVVRIGRLSYQMELLPDGTAVRPPMPQEQRSDEQGEFRFQAVAEGKITIAVRAQGLAPWQTEIELLGRVARRLEVRLEPGVILEGTVRNAAGKGLEKVSIRVGEWDDLAFRSTSSDSDGRFRIEGLPVGELSLHAESEHFGKLEAKLGAAAGQTLRWDPVLIPGLEQRGRVIDVDGNPVASAQVEAHEEAPQKGAPPWWAFENTDAQGRFTLKDCVPDQSIVVTVRRKSMFPVMRVDQLVPSSQELVIRLPKEAWVHIRGKVVGPDGRPMENVHVSPLMKGHGSSPAETTQAGTGAIDLGPYPPGEYSVHLRADGYPKLVIPTRLLGPDEVWDLGTIRFEAGGTLSVRVVGDAGGVPGAQTWRILDPGGQHHAVLELQDGVGRSDPLAPGRYRLQVAGSGLACEAHPFEVLSGVDTRLEVPVRSGIAAQLEFVGSAAIQLQGVLHLTVRDARGEPVLHTTIWCQPNTPSTLATSLAPGTYRVRAETTVAAGEGVLEVGGPAAVHAVITLTER